MIKDMTHEEYLKALIKCKISKNCPIHRALELFNGKWRTHVLFELCKKPSLRFGEIKKEIPNITSTMLTSTLRDLEEFGVVSRTQFNEIPPRVEYSLTESGQDLLPIFYEISRWSETHMK